MKPPTCLRPLRCSSAPSWATPWDAPWFPTPFHRSMKLHADTSAASCAHSASRLPIADFLPPPPAMIDDRTRMGRDRAHARALVLLLAVMSPAVATGQQAPASTT